MEAEEAEVGGARVEEAEADTVVEVEATSTLPDRWTRTLCGCWRFAVAREAAE